MHQGASDQEVSDNFAAILQTVLSNPNQNRWIYDNFSITTIQSKFNEIIQQYGSRETEADDFSNLF